MMVAEAEKCQAAGVDALQVRPRGDVWSEGGDFAYTSNKIREVVERVRAVYDGQVTIGFINLLSTDGESDLDLLTMWDAADFIYADITSLNITDSDTPSIDEMQPVFEAALTQRIAPTNSPMTFLHFFSASLSSRSISFNRSFFFIPCVSSKTFPLM
jgi:hypothetical protein